ncbi:hypothetical protein DSO57_1027457 [Entomophthora muscae]|uniref:Uncharacterized protein n=1 Tax=Entomophthora muscae TaxID=34485 RepID=A0ACC2RSW2_9FUNG|nr:hypothetical protein DSO57_1027457 [Entomophthora muscae]
MTNPSSWSLATNQDTLGDWWTGTPHPSIDDSEPSDNEAPLILLLLHNISNDSDMDNSDMEDPNAYGYSVLAVSETITVPYKLRSGKTTTTTKTLPEAKEVVSCPYLTQANRSLCLLSLLKKLLRFLTQCSKTSPSCSLFKQSIRSSQASDA